MSRVYRVFCPNGPIHRLGTFYDYPTAEYGGPWAPKEASPIYTSMALSRSYSGSRTKLTTYTGTGLPRTLTVTITESYSGSISEWTWNRVYPSAYTSIGYWRYYFEAYPHTPADPHEGYFHLAPSLNVRQAYNYVAYDNYFDPKKQTLRFYAMGAASGGTVVIGTRTTVITGLDAGGFPTSTTTTVDITANNYPSYDSLPKFLTATQDYYSFIPRLPVLTWGYLQYDEGLADYVHYGVDVTAWSATKWRDYRGSYSAVIPMPSGGTAWDSSNVETTVNWTLG